jgi:putative FmdB family regulatory protein
MPIFDYQCAACGHTFDVLQKAGEGVLRKCPECGKLKLKKLLAAPNFHLKGGGWYKTDFATSPARRTATRPVEVRRKSEGKSEDKKGHTLDSGPAHSHSADCGHSHGGHTHSHGPGGHKH